MTPVTAAELGQTPRRRGSGRSRLPTALVHCEANRGEQHGRAASPWTVEPVAWGCCCCSCRRTNRADSSACRVGRACRAARRAFLKYAALRSDRRNPQGRVGGMFGGRARHRRDAAGRQTHEVIPRHPAPSFRQTEWVLGQTLVGSRPRELRIGVEISAERSRPRERAGRMALWGDSARRAGQRAGRQLAVPLDADKFPCRGRAARAVCWPAFTALFEDARACGLRSRWPDELSVASAKSLCLCAARRDGPLRADRRRPVRLVAALRAETLRLDALVDGLNRTASGKEVSRTYETAIASYRAARAELHPHLGDEAERCRPRAVGSCSSREQAEGK